MIEIKLARQGERARERGGGGERTRESQRNDE